MTSIATPDLPNLDCGLCGYPTCTDFALQLPERPDLLKRCIHLDQTSRSPRRLPLVDTPPARPPSDTWVDSLGREYDFVLEQFPHEPGPREIILPRNPMITRELDIQPGDQFMGRPLGMSCGCPITHCGVVMAVDSRNGVITWCITGHLQARQQPPKDLGYYSAEAYEGLVSQSRSEIRVGQRYYFQPHMCMLQWRHSGLVNYVSRLEDAVQVRVEGLWIG